MCRKFSFLISFVLVLGLAVIAQAASVDITVPGDAIKGVPDDGDWPAAEAPEFVIDNNPDTKFLHFKGADQTTGIRVTPLLSGMVVTGMSFTTAGDAPERDPVSFEIYGSNVGIDGPYTLIASGDVIDFDQVDPWPRNAKNETPISFANAVAYAHYEVLVTALRVPANGCCMQVSEVELLTTVPDLTGMASIDIGTTHQGDVWDIAGQYTVRGSGADIWGNNDGFHFVCRPLSGNGIMKVNLASMTATHAWAKCGLMIRETLANDSKHAMMATSGANGCQFLARVETGDVTYDWTTSGQAPPKEMWIERVGNTFNGTFWNWIIFNVLGQWKTETVNIDMGPDAYIGMVVCSHDNAKLETAVFDTVIWPAAAVETPWLLSPADGAMDVPVDMTISWMPGDSALSSDVHFGTTDPPAFAVNQLLGNETYSPPTLAEGTVYYYQIVSQPGGQASAVMSFTTYAPPPPPCGIERCVWEGLSGRIWDFVVDGDYPGDPTWCDNVPRFDSPDNLGIDNYGGRLQGLLWPETDGDYTFWIAGDDDVDLYLSSDDTAANLTRIAVHDGWNSSYNWYDTPQQQSAPITLVGGQQYWLRALWHEGGGGDHCAVAWQGPDQPDAPVQGNSSAVIAGYYFPLCDLSPSGLVPADGATLTPDEVANDGLSFDAKRGATLYEVYFGEEGGSMALIASGMDTAVIPPAVELGKTYNWKVVISYDADVVESPVQALSTAEWVSMDIGTTGGSATKDGDCWTIAADGGDIWGNGDQFHYVYHTPTFTRNIGTVIARLNSLTNVQSWAKAGVMIRETTASGSRNVCMVATPDAGENRAAFQWRYDTNGGSDSDHHNGVFLPEWVKVERNGNVYRGYHSDNGVDWHQHGGDRTVEMGSFVRVGLAVTSHIQGVLTTAEICDYSFSTPDPRQAWNLEPRCGATGQSIHSVVNWSTGDDVALQRVYFGTDEAAVMARTTLAAEVAGDVTEYDPFDSDRHSLMLGETYYWAVDSVMADTTVIPGEICSFTAEEYRLVDDFEAYDVDPEALPPQELVPGEILLEAVPPPENAWVEPQTILLGSDDGAQIVTDPDRGQVLALDGTGDYVDCGNPDALNFGTGDWTICAWAKNTMTGTGDTNKGAIIANGGDTGGGIRYCLIQTESSEGKVNLVTDDNSKKRQAKGGTLVNDDVWHHVLGVRDGGKIRLYIDGVQDASSDINEDLSGVVQHSFKIGAITDNNPDNIYKDYEGLIDDARVYGAALSDDNILFLAEKGGTDPGAGSLLGHWAFEGDFTDSSASGFDGTPMGAYEDVMEKPGYFGPTIVHWAMDDNSGTIATDDSGNDLHGAISGAVWDATTADGSASCLDFSGAGDYVVNDDAGPYLNGLGALTISLWIKSDVIDTDKGFIIGKDPEGNDQRGFRYDKAGAGCGGVNIIKYGVATNEGAQETESSENIQTTDWQHVMVTWESGVGTTLYINGVFNQPNCPSTVRGGIMSGYTKLLVGKGGKDGAADKSWDGRIDDVWILDRVATEGERRYLAGMGNIALPDWYKPMIAEYLIETDASDTSGNNNHGIAFYGDATIVADPVRGAVGSFDGDGDAVDVGNSELFNFMDDCTISVWVNLNSWGGGWGNCIVGKRGEGGVGWQLRRFGSEPRFSWTTRGMGEDDYPRSDQNIEMGKWYHLGAVRDGTQKRLYIDGKLENTQNINSNRINTCPQKVYVGARSADNDSPEAFFDGKVDDLRIFNTALNIGHVRTLADYVSTNPIEDTWSARGAVSPKLDYNTSHGGSQSMRVEYTGDGVVKRLEPFGDGADPHVWSGDWTLGGAKSLTMHFRGSEENGPGLMFAQLKTSVSSQNTQRVMYNGDPANLSSSDWTEWNIELHDLFTGKPAPPIDEGIPGTKVKEIGVGIIGGGSGVLYFDDIRVYPTRCVPIYGPEYDLNDDCVVNEGDLQVLIGDWLDGDSTIYAVPPDSAGLLAQYLFDGDLLDSSGNGRDGTPYGAVGFETDAVMGQVLDLPGGDDQYVGVGEVGISGAMPRTIACWAKADHTSIPDWSLVFGFTTVGGGCESHFNIGSIGGPGGVGAHTWCFEATIFTDEEALDWRHYAMTYDGGTVRYYGDAELIGSSIRILTHADNLQIGSRATQTSSFPGNIEDARVYNYALSKEEILDLMGISEIYFPLESIANIYDEEPVNSKKVNFKDYATLMEQWLVEKLWP